MTDVTHILNAIEQSDAKAVNKLLSLIYEEFRRLLGVLQTRQDQAVWMGF